MSEPATALVARDSATDAAIEVTGLSMRYGGFEAVRGIDLSVRRGEVFAFLGPNGAGKTTTVEILEGYRRRTGGEVSVLGRDPESAGLGWRARLGVVLQESEPEHDLSVVDCLRLFAGYYARPRDIGETLDLVGLAGFADSRAGRLSGGQRRRLDVALALIGDPELVFLDEPTTGFDPSARRAAWEMISGLRSLGVTVFLTTHFMDEAEYLADRLAVIAGGRIVAEGTPATIGGRETAEVEVSFTPPPGVGPGDLPAPVAAALVPAVGARWVARASEPIPLLAPLLGWAQARGVSLHDLEVRRPSLEDVYLGLTAPSREAGDG
jgi:ABC-2 type transport system ATP-binding protein